MNHQLKKQLIEALKDQKEIFGDELFEEIEMKRKTAVVADNKNKSVEEPELFPEEKEEWEKAETLEKLEGLINQCIACKLHEGRNKFVFGSGNPNADVMVVGEGPGAEEDKQGLPFVGRAGKLLTDILKAIKFERDDVYIANIVKCRPPDNRTPLPDEMDICLPYLKKQIEIIKPKLILCLGLTAAKGLLKKRDSLTSMRGKVYEFENIKVMVTYHPAALLRNPNWKRPCWEDLQKFKKLYDELTG
uniref:Type-4 uracil-DNA glycosylase n=1 Tax=uncultured bacterium W5-47b TaxID=1130998 RepID=H9BX42_9BACT|nr:phage SPO1 DNA polymerase-like protein [uncultured bacterium W5-47b]